MAKELAFQIPGRDEMSDEDDDDKMRTVTAKPVHRTNMRQTPKSCNCWWFVSLHWAASCLGVSQPACRVEEGPLKVTGADAVQRASFEKAERSLS